MRGRRQPAPRAHFFWRFVFPGVVVAAAVAVFLLAREGGRAVLDTTFEEVPVPIELQPDEPGYLELVGVTPTLLSLHTHDGALTGISFIALTGFDAGGGVVLLPADLLVEPGGGDTDQGELISEVYARGGADAVEQVAEALFWVGFDEVIEVPTESLAEAMAPAAPLPYLLVDDLSSTGADGVPRVVYEAGRRDLAAADAAAIYSVRNPNEADVNRVQRQRDLWQSWLDVVGRAADPAAAVPPPSSPMSRFLQALGAGTAVVEVPPLRSVVSDPALPPRYVLDDEERACSDAGRSWLRDKARELVPRPRQPESFLRPRVKLLDGTGDPAVRDSLVDDIIAAGGIVAEIGNADEFGIETTRFDYHRVELVNDLSTNCIAIRLGVDMALSEADAGTPEAVDITVTVGSDQAAR